MQTTSTHKTNPVGTVLQRNTKRLWQRAPAIDKTAVATPGKLLQAAIRLLIAALALFLSLPAQATLTYEDINPAGSSYPRNLTVFDSKLYFQATDSTSGYELWSTDGTTTSRVADIWPGSGNSTPSYLTVFNDRLYFSADDGTSGYELWSTNGTTTTTSRVEDINPAGNSYPNYLTVFNNRLYFTAYDGTSGTELWSTNGTTTSRVEDIRPGVDSSYPSNLTVFNNRLYFTAYDGTSGTELWSTDGTTTSRVEDINLGPGGSTPSNLTVFNNKLYFSANDVDSGAELWVTNGTTTSRVADISPGVGSSFPSNLTVFNNKLYFSAYDGTSGYELWSTDGTNTSLVADINPAGSSSPSSLTVFNNRLYFSANDGISGYELWSTDGTTTSRVADIRPGTDGSAPSNLSVFNNKLYFQAHDGTSGYELWSTDGTTTSRVADIRPGADSSSPYYLTAFNNRLYFQAQDNTRGIELWVLDPMQLTSRTPATAATDVAVSTDSLSLTFSEAITAGAGSISVHKASDDSVVDSIDVATGGVAVNGQTATISLLVGVLSPNTGYYVTVPSGAFKGEGNEEFPGLTSTTAWTFTTAAATPATSPADLSASRLWFGNFPVGFTTNVQTISIRNNGSDAIELAPASLASGSDFAVVNNGCPATLGAGVRCLVTVSFTPTTTGDLSDTLTLNDLTNNVPLQVQLSGTGTAAGTEVLQSSVDFRTVMVGSSVTKRVTWANKTAAAQTVSTHISGDPAIAITRDCDGQTVKVRNSCTVSVTFTPTAHAATSNSTLTITDTAGGSFSIPLTGLGK